MGRDELSIFICSTGKFETNLDNTNGSTWAELREAQTRRLLGDHVPYPVEAYPEGGQRQLSAESGLYCRIFTEGLFGIRPTGLKSFTFTPRLPKSWPAMGLKHIHAFDRDFDIVVQRIGNKLKTTVSESGNKIVDKLINEGDIVKVNLLE